MQSTIYVYLCVYIHYCCLYMLYLHQIVHIVVNRGQNPLHLLGQFSRENGAAIFELFLECMPNYPIDQPDINGNTCK